MVGSPEGVTPTLIVRAGGSAQQYWRDLWQYRELFYFLSWRDVAVRYKQTVIGVGWAVVRPVLTMVVFTAIFGGIANLPSDGSPYPLMVFVGMLPWQFFSGAMVDASNSLVLNTSIVTKVYFPRVIIPASAVITNLVDLAISAGVLALLLAYYGVAPNPRVLMLPVFIGIPLLAAAGAGLALAALNVKYRDVRYIVPFIVQLGLYVSPVGFSSAVVPERWRFFYSLNPMVAAIDGFRWAILGNDTQLDVRSMLAGTATALALATIGFWYFRRTERHFADLI